MTAYLLTPKPNYMKSSNYIKPATKNVAQFMFPTNLFAVGRLQGGKKAFTSSSRRKRGRNLSCTCFCKPNI